MYPQETKFTYTGKQIKEFAQSLDDNETYFVMKCPLKWKSRSKAQNATFYWLRDELSNFIWYDKEKTKDCLLKWTFWVEKTEFCWVIYETALVNETSKLDISRFRYLIEMSLEFCKKLWFEIVIISREFRNLFDNMK